MINFTLPTQKIKVFFFVSPLFLLIFFIFFAQIFCDKIFVFVGFFFLPLSVSLSPPLCLSLFFFFFFFFFLSFFLGGGGGLLQGRGLVHPGWLYKQRGTGGFLATKLGGAGGGGGDVYYEFGGGLLGRGGGVFYEFGGGLLGGGGWGGRGGLG